MGRKVELAIGILNGLVGDYLAKTGNGLAIDMELLERRGSERGDERADATPRIAVLVHGSSSTESTWDMPDGSDDYGARLARDLGYTPIYVRYNSGLPIADTGAELARRLQALVATWPVAVEEILPVGHSMGGLVIRSACHVATVEKLRWLALVRRAIYLGTPHLGSPVERLGRVVAKVLVAVGSPYTRLVADVGNLRSAGIRDLGDADLRHEDRALQHGSGFSLRDARHPVPLLPHIQHFLVAGALLSAPRLAMLLGDVLVPVASATAGHCTDLETLGLPPSHVRCFPGVGHIALSHSAEVYAQIRTWCTEAA